MGLESTALSFLAEVEIWGSGSASEVPPDLGFLSLSEE
jgi:hypothetical protein